MDERVRSAFTRIERNNQMLTWSVRIQAAFTIMNAIVIFLLVLYR